MRLSGRYITWTSKPSKQALGMKSRVGGAAFRKRLDRLVESETDERFVAPIQPFLMNERLAAQQGMFSCPSTLKIHMDVLFSQPEDFRLFVDAEAKRIKDSFSEEVGRAFKNMLREVSRMNINSASPFPAIEGHARSIRETYESLEDEAPAYTQIALDDGGFRLDRVGRGPLGNSTISPTQSV